MSIKSIFHIFSTLTMLALSACGGSSVSSPLKPIEKAAPASTAIANMDEETSQKLDELLALRAKNQEESTGKIIDILSAAFLQTPYRGKLLIGSNTVPEKLVIDFHGLDCFTFLDYVEAARHSIHKTDFLNHLIETRYVNGDVNFINRRHFFTDWAYRPKVLADDITSTLSANAVTTKKALNYKSDATLYLPGLPVVQRSVTYIPSNFVDDFVISQLQTGDFIGIYSRADGLDVTHVGIFIKTNFGPIFRNASSKKKYMKVIDSPFVEYIRNTPGIVVLRPKNYQG
ncbi:N-acetylmuramoyl-L-alanine amidase-like domain-containing protein [Burkholderia oklahomensis]|uniref:Lipoprotein n=1 Tax=Burkholderia oklahomensis TaxID=342113 RepID=A0AAI8BE55_9BURK|nr:N-acetylmuramoyl-L-alanine amidase-like domain-containing protein [Burkholderia oklahomensis]AIO70344.1 hypothetical protein DM82_5782 [Burkholderia oklahomensis]QPS40794.1 DUF1460 domain-containing protein [Burkholderia oklahomensis]